MDERVIARRYARAFYKHSYAGDVLATALPALGEFARLFATQEDLRSYLLHPGISPDAKGSLLARLVGEGLALEFLQLLLAKERLALLPTIAEEAWKYYRRDAGIVTAELTTAGPVGDDFPRALTATLEKMTGKKVELTARVDPSVLGGVRLVIGDYVIDDTLAARLKGIRDAMAGVA